VFKDHDVPPDVPEVTVPPDVVADGRVWLPKALVAAGLATSNGEARRAIEQGGVRIDGEVVSDPALELDPGSLVGSVLQVGRRRFARIVAIA
jgi:tyrosyl-tRNA synthetase